MADTSARAPFDGHAGPVRAIAITPDGEVVVSVGGDGTVYAWNLASGDRMAYSTSLAAQVRAVTVNDGLSVVLCDEDGVIWEWNAYDGKKTKTRTGHSGAVVAATFTTNGERVVTAGIDGRVWVWPREDGAQVATMSEHSDWITAVAVPPGTLEVITCDDKGMIRTWDLSSGDERSAFGGKIGRVRAVVGTADGAEIVTGGEDGVVRLWQRDASQRHTEFTGRTGSIWTVAVAPNGLLIAAGDGGAVHVWDRARPTEPTVLNGHDGSVHAIAVTPDGKRLVSGGDDHTIRVWDLAGAAQIAGTGFTHRPPPRPLPGVTSDAESAEDLLGFRDDVHALADLITDRETEPPLCVALLGRWGSGKSSFMRQLQDRVTTLADLPRDHPGRGVFASTVRQVRFNAWHYSDDHLWVGLVEHLFANLTDPEAPPDPDKLRAERERLRARLDKLKSRQSYLERASGRGGLARLSGLLPANRWAAVAVLIVAVLGVAAVMIGWLVLGNVLVTVLGAFVAALVPVMANVAAGWRVVGKVPASVRMRNEARKQTVDREVREATAQLDRLDAAQRLSSLIQEVRSGRYEQYRGLLGRVHVDLRRLSEDMQAALTEWRQNGAVGPAPLERIVLYVDDLDRCPPRKVVDVLAAVHLLLALPLFVVVVAVDPRWLRRSLEQHHRELFSGGLASDGVSKPLDYLDKIFQVTFALRPMGRRADNLLEALLPPAVPDGEPGAATSTSPGGKPDDRSGATSPPRTSSGPGPVPQPGTPLPDEPGLRPDRLRLREAERGFARRLLPLLATPREVKKLVNLYRLVRIGVPDETLDRFVGAAGGGPYQAVLVMLAMIVTAPPAARVLIAELRDHDADGDITDITDLLATLEAEPCRQLGDLIKEIRKDTDVLGDLAIYRAWGPTIARFSFETHDLVGEE